jgi:hypothetical protein
MPTAQEQQVLLDLRRGLQYLQASRAITGTEGPLSDRLTSSR